MLSQIQDPSNGNFKTRGKPTPKTLARVWQKKGKRKRKWGSSILVVNSRNKGRDLEGYDLVSAIVNMWRTKLMEMRLG